MTSYMYLARDRQPHYNIKLFFSFTIPHSLSLTGLHTNKPKLDIWQHDEGNFQAFGSVHFLRI